MVAGLIPHWSKLHSMKKNNEIQSQIQGTLKYQRTETKHCFPQTFLFPEQEQTTVTDRWYSCDPLLRSRTVVPQCLWIPFSDQQLWAPSGVQHSIQQSILQLTLFLFILFERGFYMLGVGHGL